MPRYVSMKANEGNVRRGPSLSHRIDWVFQRRNMPLQVIAEYGHWRRVIDRGAGVERAGGLTTRLQSTDEFTMPLSKGEVQ